jgi:hypothetical protein
VDAMLGSVGEKVTEERVRDEAADLSCHCSVLLDAG